MSHVKLALLVLGTVLALAGFGSLLFSRRGEHMRVVWATIGIALVCVAAAVSMDWRWPH